MLAGFGLGNMPAGSAMGPVTVRHGHIAPIHSNVFSGRSRVAAGRGNSDRYSHLRLVLVDAEMLIIASGNANTDRTTAASRPPRPRPPARPGHPKPRVDHFRRHGPAPNGVGHTLAKPVTSLAPAKIARFDPDADA